MANFIQTLQSENKAQAREIQALRDGLRDLLSYVTSAKFTACEGPLLNYVNVQDVTLRIREIENFATDKRENQD